MRKILKDVPTEIVNAIRDAEAFNARYPIGTPVRYWPHLREGKGRLSRTRSKAFPMSDHASVMVKGYDSSINLSHVEPIDGKEAPDAR